MEATCAVEGCDRPRKTRGLCQAHNLRRHRHCDVQADVPIGPSCAKIDSDTCAVDGCDRPRKEQAQGRHSLCVGHFSRKKRTGDVRADVPIRNRGAFDPAVWLTYGAAHTRVTVRRGSASMHPCVDCGRPAQEWSYNHEAEHEFTGPHHSRTSRTVTWSGDPADYEPRCRSCHHEFDGS